MQRAGGNLEVAGPGGPFPRRRSKSPLINSLQLPDNPANQTPATRHETREHQETRAVSSLQLSIWLSPPRLPTHPRFVKLFPWANLVPEDEHQ